MLGYALAKLEFAGKRVVFVLVLATLMVPAIVTFMPLFVLISNMGLANTHAGLILPFLVGALGVFLMRQFISGIPDELLDAARSRRRRRVHDLLQDRPPAVRAGAGDARDPDVPRRVGTRSCGRSSSPAPRTCTRSRSPLALFSIGQQETNVALQMAGAVVVVLPVVILFFAMQRFITQGIATTGIK